jgi:hypothetical protein
MINVEWWFRPFRNLVMSAYCASLIWATWVRADVWHVLAMMSIICLSLCGLSLLRRNAADLGERPLAERGAKSFLKAAMWWFVATSLAFLGGELMALFPSNWIVDLARALVVGAAIATAGYETNQGARTVSTQTDTPISAS